MIRTPPCSTLFRYTTLFRSIYFNAWNDFLKVFQLDADTDTLSLSSNSMTKLAFPGATPSVSANGNTDGIVWIDRKSTRLNSSHANISYAVFCLKKKTQKEYN